MLDFLKPTYNMADYRSGRVGPRGETRPLMDKAKGFVKKAVGQLPTEAAQEQYWYDNYNLMTNPREGLGNKKYIDQINTTVDRLNYYNYIENLMTIFISIDFILLFLHIFLHYFYSKDLDNLDEIKNKKLYQKIIYLYYNNYHLITFTLCFCIFANLLFKLKIRFLSESISPAILYILGPHILMICIIIFYMRSSYINDMHNDIL
jgi:hypothetical protein